MGAASAALFAFAVAARRRWSTIPKSGSRFSDKIVLKRKDQTLIQFH
jgi:hypothetical protein